MDNDKDLRRVWFPRWAEVLGNSALEDGVKTSHLRIIKWFLHECKVNRWIVCVESGRRFLDAAVKSRQPEPEVLAEWKAALNWFFVTARHQQESGEQGIPPSGCRRPGNRPKPPRSPPGGAPPLNRRCASQRS